MSLIPYPAHNATHGVTMNDRHAISPYPIRMPVDLRARLEESARDGARSLHAEIISRLEDSFQAASGGLDSMNVSDLLTLLAAKVEANGLEFEFRISAPGFKDEDESEDAD